MFGKGTAHVPERAPAGALPKADRTAYSAIAAATLTGSRRAVSLSLSLSLSRSATIRPPLPTPPPYARCPGPGRALPGDEHVPGMPAPSLPFLLLETKHPNPNLNYLAICNRIWSYGKCIHVLCLLLASIYFLKRYRVYMCIMSLTGSA
jgi:hypothetical protein